MVTNGTRKHKQEHIQKNRKKRAGGVCQEHLHMFSFAWYKRGSVGESQNDSRAAIFLMAITDLISIQLLTYYFLPGNRSSINCHFM